MQHTGVQFQSFFYETLLKGFSRHIIMEICYSCHQSKVTSKLYKFMQATCTIADVKRIENCYT